MEVPDWIYRLPWSESEIWDEAVLEMGGPLISLNSETWPLKYRVLVLCEEDRDIIARKWMGGKKGWITLPKKITEAYRIAAIPLCPFEPGEWA